MSTLREDYEVGTFGKGTAVTLDYEAGCTVCGAHLKVEDMAVGEVTK